jgi:hypothetical protein
MTAIRKALALAALTVALLTIPASAAGAAEFGSDCSADQISMSGFIMVQEQKEPGSPFPVAAPFAGILTSWTSRGDAFGAEPNVGYMKVLRPAVPGEFTVIGESTSELVGPGTHTHPARIAVGAGDRVALFGNEGSFYCDTSAPGDLVWSLNRNLAIGSSALFAANAPGIQVPVSATVEPDSDNDGFGDETQDRCPQLATLHEVPCPSLTLSFFSLVTKKAVLVYVSAGTQARITVSAKAGKKLTLKPLEHLADPGLITKFKLPLSAALLKKLAATPRSKSLGLKVTASGVNAAGIPKSETRTLRLKGRG